MVQAEESKYGYPIKEIGGKPYIGIPRSDAAGVRDEALGVNWLPYYPLPEQNDFNGFKKLFDGLERRFMNHVSRGGDIRGNQREALMELLEKAQADGTGEAALAALRADASIATQKHGCNLAVLYINAREMMEEKDLSYETQMKELLKKPKRRERLVSDGIGSVLTDVETKTFLESATIKDLPRKAMAYMSLAIELSGAMTPRPNIRRENHLADRDKVIGEILTEAYHILNGVSPEPGAREAFENIFHKNRFHKASGAIDGIRLATEAIQKVMEHAPELAGRIVEGSEKGLNITQVLDDLSARAQKRACLMRSDSAYEMEDVMLRVNRNLLMEVKLPTAEDAPQNSGHMARLQKSSGAKMEQAHTLMHQAVELIYDMSEVRLNRPKSVKEFQAQAQEFVRIHGGPKMGGQSGKVDSPPTWML